MKKITLIILVLFVLASAIPASAARELPTVGEVILIHPADVPPPPEVITFDAGKAFHIRHGWCWNTGTDQAVGVRDFRLSIDGVPVEDGLRFTQPSPDQTSGCGNLGFGSITRIYNFPDGLPAGTYTFEGFWYISCQYGPNPSECTDPNAPVLAIYSNVPITFTQP